MSYLEVFGVLTRVGVDVSKCFGVGAGVLKHGAGVESESEKCDSTHLWYPWVKIRVCSYRFMTVNQGQIGQIFCCTSSKPNLAIYPLLAWKIRNLCSF